MPLFVRGARFGDHDRWLVLRKVGEGQFAEVYEVRDTTVKDKDLRLAVKVEKRKENKTVRAEYKVLKRLQPLGSQICQVYETGVHDDRFYIVMQLLGPNLAELRKAEPEGRYDMAAMRRIAMSTLSALEAVHGAGLIHRDVKPANFAISPPSAHALSGTWHIIDFGLARRFQLDDGRVLPARAMASFRGSTMYASCHAHLELDLGRRDDLWSWFYIIVELVEGSLPWRSDKDAEQRELVLRRKQACMGKPQELMQTMPIPDALLWISNYLRSLDYGDTPSYDYVRQCLLQLPVQAAAPRDHLAAVLPLLPAAGAAAAVGGAVGWAPGVPPPTGYTGGTSGGADTPLSPLADTPLSPPEDAPEASANGMAQNAAAPPHVPRVQQLPATYASTEATAATPREGLNAGPPPAANGLLPPGSAAMDVDSVTAACASCRGSGDAELLSGRAAEVAEYLEAFKASASAPARQATNSLCALSPSEALGAVAALVDALPVQCAVSHLPLAAQLLADLAAFTHAAAHRAVDRHRAQHHAAHPPSPSAAHARARSTPHLVDAHTPRGSLAYGRDLQSHASQTQAQHATTTIQHTHVHEHHTHNHGHHHHAHAQAWQVQQQHAS